MCEKEKQIQPADGVYFLWLCSGLIPDLDKTVAKCKQRQASHPSKRNPKVIVKVRHYLECSDASRASPVIADNSQHVLRLSAQGLRRSELLKGTLRCLRGEQQRIVEGWTSVREGNTAANCCRAEFSV